MSIPIEITLLNSDEDGETLTRNGEGNKIFDKGKALIRGTQETRQQPGGIFFYYRDSYCSEE